MKNSIQKGFTLIELLVVITIIGILAGILFVAIDPKKQTDKAEDVKLKSNINAIRQIAYNVFTNSNPNSYVGVESDADVVKMMAGVNNGEIKSNENSWAVKGQLSDSKYFCRDYRGYVSIKNTQDITDFKCD